MTKPRENETATDPKLDRTDDPASAKVAGEKAQPANRAREHATGPAIRTLASGEYGLKRRQDSGSR